MSVRVEKRIVAMLSVLLVGLSAGGCTSHHDATAKHGNANAGGIGGESLDASELGGESGSSTSGTEAGAPGQMPGCPTPGPIGILCPPLGFPFVLTALPFTPPTCQAVECSPVQSQPEPGTLCLAGATAQAAQGVMVLILQVGDVPFDAAALGIAQLSFTIDSPPPAGVLVYGGILAHSGCRPGTELACTEGGFALPPITQAGTSTWSFDDFVQQDQWSHYQTFDPHLLAAFTIAAADGPYDFCIRDFKFLDADGAEVKP